MNHQKLIKIVKNKFKKFVIIFKNYKIKMTKFIQMKKISGNNDKKANIVHII